MRHCTGRLLSRALVITVASLALVAVASQVSPAHAAGPWTMTDYNDAGDGTYADQIGEFRVDVTVVDNLDGTYTYTYDLYINTGEDVELAPGGFAINSRLGVAGPFPIGSDPAEDGTTGYDWGKGLAEPVLGNPGIRWQNTKDGDEVTDNTGGVTPYLIGTFSFTSTGPPGAGRFDITGSPDQTSGDTLVPTPELPTLMLLLGSLPAAGVAALRRRFGL